MMPRKNPTAIAATLLVLASVAGAGAAAAAPAHPARPRLHPALVTVGDPGNPADPATGFGAVGTQFRIAATPVTIGQYAVFLNAVARTRDPHGLWNPRMADDLTVAGIARSGHRGHYVYTVIAPAGAVQSAAATAANRPITYVSWFDAARFANWMSNGQPRGEQSRRTTETGAYDLTRKAARQGSAVPVSRVNPHTHHRPLYTLPTENEWYKAAYYSPALNSGSGGYYSYATMSNTAPGNKLDGTPAQANYTYAGRITLTGAYAVDLSQNFLSDVGSFTGSPGAYGTYDMNGNVWEWNDSAATASPSRSLRGGGWTSYFTYLQSSYRLGNAPASQSSNAGFRLASSLAPAQSTHYALSEVGNPGNTADATGYGAVASTFSIGTYEVTIGQYVDFLNAVALTDPYGLYDSGMASMKNSAGIARTGSSGAYAYSSMNNGGDSSQRPIAYVSWFDAARFANWMANGRPSGAQGPTTTEDGAYTLGGTITGSAVAPNAVNPNTALAPTFFIPTEDQWYKAAYYSPALNSGAGGYYAYATQSNTAPGNHLGSTPNQVNYIDDYTGANTYAVTQTVSIDSTQNYLTDVGYFAASPSYYGAFDLNGNVYTWNDLDGSTSVVRGLRGGFWFSGPPSIQSATRAETGVGREANDTGIRLVAR